jgi:hypothetical protein
MGHDIGVAGFRTDAEIITVRQSVDQIGAWLAQTLPSLGAEQIGDLDAGGGSLGRYSNQMPIQVFAEGRNGISSRWAIHCYVEDKGNAREVTVAALATKNKTGKLMGRMAVGGMLGPVAGVLVGTQAGALYDMKGSRARRDKIVDALRKISV